MNFSHDIDRFQLYDQLAPDQKVESAFPNGVALIGHDDGVLLGVRNASQFQLDNQRLLVGLLLVARPEQAVNFDGSADHGKGHMIDACRWFFHLKFLLLGVFLGALGALAVS